MFKSCSRCGRIHQVGHECPKPKRIFTTTEERKLRSKWKWTEKSREIRDKANHLCEVCRDKGEITYDDIEVHHIRKLRDDEGGLLDNYNLIVLCQEHHKQADRNEIDIDYLMRLAKKREESK